jgi:hypothetical protein
MLKRKWQKSQSGTLPSSNYVQNTLLLGIFVVIVTFIYRRYFGFWNDHLIPIWITVGGIGFLILFSFFRDTWQRYRWITISVVIFFIVLVDTSWAKSNLDINAVETRQSVEYVIPTSTAVLHAEYPTQILYNSDDAARLVLWLMSPIQGANPIIVISSDDLFFSMQVSSVSQPPHWKKTVEVELPTDGSELTLLIQPVSPNLETTKQSKILFMNNSTELQSESEVAIRLEGRQDARSRFWKIALMDTGSISLIIGIAIAWFEIQRKEDEEKHKKKEKEEEEQLKRINEIKRLIEKFDDLIKKDFSQAITDYCNYLQDWKDWNGVLQQQFREGFSSFIDTGLWDAVSDKHIKELESDIEQCIQLSKIISVAPRQLKLVKASLQQDANAVLTLLKEYPESVTIVKQIARSFPEELKREIPNTYGSEFPSQIIDIKNELAFIGTDNHPLQKQFHYYSKPPDVQERLTTWMKKHQMLYSPFIDSIGPNTPIPKEKNSLATGEFFIQLVTAGFNFPIFERPNEYFEFANSWDTCAGLFEYIRNLPLRVRNDELMVLLTPAIVTNFGKAQPRQLLLHALAEQWLWILADTPTMFYSLNETQRALLGRLLYWHAGSSFAVVNTLERLINSHNEKEYSKKFLTRILEWLNDVEVTTIRVEEFNTLITLRPPSKIKTRLLISSVDLNPSSSNYIAPEIHELLDRHTEWMSEHDWLPVHFISSNTNYQMVSLSDLQKLCQLRMLKCSAGKIESFHELFVPHEEGPSDIILARKANGSPGKMIQLGQKLLLQHVERFSPDEDLHIEDLIGLS